MTYNLTSRATASFLGAALILVACAPLFTHAQALSQGSFCNNLDTIKTRTLDRQAERATKHASTRTKVTDQFAEK